jgi:hypothetical protein
VDLVAIRSVVVVDSPSISQTTGATTASYDLAVKDG